MQNYIHCKFNHKLTHVLQVKEELRFHEMMVELLVQYEPQGVEKFAQQRLQTSLGQLG